MTLSEFKAWFEGFTECMDGAPDKDQWKRIKARVKEIDGVAVTKTVFVDRYLPPYRPYYDRMWWSAQGVGNIALLSQNTAISSDQNAAFDAYGSMLDLGKAEYSSSSARSIS